MSDFSEDRNLKTELTIVKCLKYLLVAVTSDQNRSLIVSCISSEDYIELNINYGKGSNSDEVEKIFTVSKLLHQIHSCDDLIKFELSKISSSNEKVYEKFVVEKNGDPMVWRDFDSNYPDGLICQLRFYISYIYLTKKLKKSIENEVSLYMHLLYISNPYLDIGFIGEDRLLIQHQAETSSKLVIGGNCIDFQLATDSSNFVFDCKDDEVKINFQFSKPRLLALQSSSTSHLILKVGVGMIPIESSSQDRYLKVFSSCPFSTPIFEEQNLNLHLWDQLWKSYNLKLSPVNFQHLTQPIACWELSCCDSNQVNTDIIIFFSFNLIDPEIPRSSVERFLLSDWIEENLEEILNDNEQFVKVCLVEALSKTIALSKASHLQQSRDLAVVNSVSAISEIIQNSYNSLFRQTCFDLLQVSTASSFEQKTFELFTNAVKHDSK